TRWPRDWSSDVCSSDLLSWEYSQSNGMLIHVDDESGVKTAEGWGYSGTGQGLNNPGMQYVGFTGPLPQGSYTIGTQGNHKSGPVDLLKSMKLTPTGDTEMGGRGGFLIHGGDYQN